MKKNKRLYILLSFALILILVCALLQGVGFSKYRSEVVFANEVEYTNTLAESFMLLDKPVTVQEDGSYSLDETAEAEPTSGFTYKLIPGISIPAAPYVEIKNKTVIPAYLYLEVDNSGAVELNIDENWSALEGVQGKKGGTVYCYKNEALVGSAGETQADNSGEEEEAEDEDEVLTIPTVTVKDLDKVPATDEGTVKLYAYMIQKVEEQTAAEAYNSAPSV